MDELLTFEEHLQKPTDDGTDYRPYFATQIAIENGNSLIVTCHDEEDTKESIDRLNALIASSYILHQDDFRFDDIEPLNKTQFRLSGDLREILEEIVRAGCISKDLKDKIFLDVKFVQLSSANSSLGKIATLLKTHEPELWETLTTSPEEREKLILELQRTLSKSSPHDKPSPPRNIK